jgi:hypothetical protein
MDQSVSPSARPHEHAQLVNVDPIGAPRSGGPDGVIAPGGRVMHDNEFSVGEIGQPQGSVTPPREEHHHPLPLGEFGDAADGAGLIPDPAAQLRERQR